jgi:hypothetical protein
VTILLPSPWAKLAGTGFVAYKHWGPASGMGGFALANLTELKMLALVMGIVGLATVVAAGCVVVANGDLPRVLPVRLRILCCLAGAVVALSLPIRQAAASADMRDANSIAAIALIYAVPWAVSVALVGWLSRPGRHRRSGFGRARLHARAVRAADERPGLRGSKNRLRLGARYRLDRIRYPA